MLQKLLDYGTNARPAFTGATSERTNKVDLILKRIPETGGHHRQC